MPSRANKGYSNVDLDVFYGTLEELRAVGGIATTPAPAPAPAPTPQPPAPTPQPAPQPVIPAPVAHLPLCMYPATKTVLVDGKTPCTTVHIVKEKDGAHLQDAVNKGTSPIHTMQSRLINHGFPCEGGADGDMGKHSHDALVAFQKAKHLVVTGQTDVPTWVALLA